MISRMSETQLVTFRAGDDGQDFERLGVENGSRTWKESDLAVALGYAETSSFRKAVTRGMQACLSLGISIEENFHLEGGAYKLTRFACYLVAMNADAKKTQVASAQVYFARLAETFANAYEHVEGVERIAIREEMADGNKALSATAKAHGVKDYALFQNAGYRGMYNMDLRKLKDVKGLPDGQKLLDRMSKAELAGNLFRVTQTEESIKSKNLRGQQQLEQTAKNIGSEVRRMMIANTGTAPESIPLAPPIKDVKKALKSASKRFKKLDAKKIK